MSNNGNGTQVAVAFEDGSEKVPLSRQELQKDVQRMEVVADGFRYELAHTRQDLTRMRDSMGAEKRRADKAERECVFLLQRLHRVPKPIRGFFDRIHRIRRAWQVLTGQA